MENYTQSVARLIAHWPKMLEALVQLLRVHKLGMVIHTCHPSTNASSCCLLERRTLALCRSTEGIKCEGECPSASNKIQTVTFGRRNILLCMVTTINPNNTEGKNKIGPQVFALLNVSQLETIAFS